MLLLTKPLGVGVLTTAAKGRGWPAGGDGPHLPADGHLNRAAQDIMVKYRIRLPT